jgi:hypothetical protein
MVHKALDMAVLGNPHGEVVEEPRKRHGGRTRRIPKRGRSVDVLLEPLEGGLDEVPEKHFDHVLADPMAPQP